MIFVPFLTMTLVRVLSWSFIFAYLKNYGFLMLGIVFFASLLPLLFFKNDLGFQEIVLGTITALFGPCIVGHDFTLFYLISGLVNSFLMITSLLILTPLVIFDHDILTHPKALATNVTLNSIWSNIFGEQYLLP